MTINWETIIISVISSGVISAIITSIWNEKTQIKVIKESGLYAKRARVLDEMIRKIEKVHSLASSAVAPYKISDRENSSLFKFINEFEEYYVNNKHYLPEEISKEIYILNSKYFEIYADSLNNKFVSKKLFKDMTDSDMDEWNKKNMNYITALNDKKEKIVDEFRKIIGVK